VVERTTKRAKKFARNTENRALYKVTGTYTYGNPVIGRFINLDAFVSSGTGFGGFNMFAYCENNPVMYVDYNGSSFSGICNPLNYPLAPFFEIASQLENMAILISIVLADSATPILEIIVITTTAVIITELFCIHFLMEKQILKPKIPYLPTKI